MDNAAERRLEEMTRYLMRQEAEFARAFPDAKATEVVYLHHSRFVNTLAKHLTSDLSPSDAESAYLGVCAVGIPLVRTFARLLKFYGPGVMTEQQGKFHAALTDEISEYAERFNAGGDVALKVKAEFTQSIEGIYAET